MWTIWYTDSVLTGNTFEEWKGAPDTGVLAVHLLKERKETYNVGIVCLGSDWYWMLPDGTIDQNLQTSDVQDYWVDVDAPDGAALKSGSWISEERMLEVYDDIKRMIEE